MPKKVNKKSSVTAVATLSDEVIDNRHYIVNGYPECISFWALTSKLKLIRESELIDLIRLNVDVVKTVGCNGCCTIVVTSNGSMPWEKPTTRKRTVKSPCCDGKCLVHIKRIL